MLRETELKLHELDDSANLPPAQGAMRIKRLLPEAAGIDLRAAAFFGIALLVVLVVSNFAS